MYVKNSLLAKKAWCISDPAVLRTSPLATNTFVSRFASASRPQEAHQTSNIKGIEILDIETYQQVEPCPKYGRKIRPHSRAQNHISSSTSTRFITTITA